jgi:hypothetical protein
MINDGLWCPFENWHMGNAGEVASEWAPAIAGRLRAESHKAAGHERRLTPDPARDDPQQRDADRFQAR